jgi:hypothetical protein
MPQPATIALNSRWIRKQVPIEVEVTRITFREVTHIALDKITLFRVTPFGGF